MNAFVQTMRGLGPARLASMAGVALGLLGFLVYFAVHFSSADESLLYSNLAPEDAKIVVSQLGEMQIPYTLKNKGSEIYVPADKVLKLRVHMSQFAMPSGSAGGYEIFDKSSALGTTSFIQNVNLVRALEGELSRTIRSIEGVKSARVHLVLPKRELFTQEERKPSASVVVNTAGKRLKPKIVTSIQHIVGDAVPKLDINDISIIDEKGVLLTRHFEDDEEMLRVTNEERRRDYEKRLSVQITEMLERSVGFQKVRANVNVEMDFDHVVINKEEFDPDGQVVRSTVTVEENAASSEANPDAVTVGENLPDSTLSAPNTSTSSSQGRTEETVNYEVTKKVTNLVKNIGVVKRISVAVLVDGTYTENEDGEVQYSARSEEEMQMLNALVRTAMGYDANRGDQLEVVNMRFASLDDIFEKEKIVFAGLNKDEVMRLIEGLSVAVVAILVILIVIRPLISRAFEPAPDQFDEQMMFAEQGLAAPQLLGPGMGSEEEEMETDELIDIAKVEGRVKASSLRKIGEIIESHPDEALNILRAWMYQES